MRLQFVSDLHLELGQPYSLTAVAGDAIALLGDIGYPHTDEYQEFVRACAAQYTHVFVVAGNHEYYRRQKTHEYTAEVLRTFCAAIDNVHFLDDQAVVIDGVRFVGCTLWTRLDFVTGPIVVERMTDYRAIKKKVQNSRDGGSYMKVPISWRDTARWHATSTEFIERQLVEARRANQKMVVMTHHAPTLDVRAQVHVHEESSAAYATDLSHITRAPITVWMYGHTHRCADFTVNGVRLVSNARGYPGEDTGGFAVGKYIDV